MTTNVMNRLNTLGLALAATLCIGAAAPVAAHAQMRVRIGISVGTAPPPLPVYDQPLVPGPNYLWMPGYWAWSADDGYYWVPGAWVLPPESGLLWTPGYWGWEPTELVYVWHPGYWARHVGFYGGINYGFGYFGTGYVGGRWVGARFLYNTAVTRVNTRIVHNVYVDRTVVVNRSHLTVDRVSYNGGHGGVVARPVPEQLAMHDRHVTMTRVQRTHQRFAERERDQPASVTHDHPRRSAVDHPYGPGNRPAHAQAAERLRAGRVAPRPAHVERDRERGRR